VLVVGAGPVGLLLACELARRGVAVRLIDKLPSPTSESRAIIVHARSLEMMERVGVADEVISTGLTVKAAELHLDGTTATRMPLDTVDSPYPFSVTLPQTETERILAGRPRELGVEVERGTELLGFDQDDARVEASLRLADGRQETAGFAFVVGADGSHSTVRSAAGTNLEGTFVGEKFHLEDSGDDYPCPPFMASRRPLCPRRWPTCLWPRWPRATGSGG
jgi:2-polyprenyl-6-methoxyphenol hydroxylase-like FAD-dependent oxidoreductase